MKLYIDMAKIYLLVLVHAVSVILLLALIFLSHYVSDDFVWFLVPFGLFLFPGTSIISARIVLSGRWSAEILRTVERQYRPHTWWYSWLFYRADNKPDAPAVVVFRNYKKVFATLAG